MSSKHEKPPSQKIKDSQPRGQIFKSTSDNIHGLLINPHYILLFLVVFRGINALCIQTFFQPDEYFQSLEPAWEMAFGRESGAWITWEWQHQLRSSLHPAMFAAIYCAANKAMLLLGLLPPLRASILGIVPALTQAVIAATGDYYTWKLSGKIHSFESYYSLATLLLTALSPWQWFVSTRTFSNCLETTLTIAALYYWPWEMTLDSVPSSMSIKTIDTTAEQIQKEHVSRSSIFSAPGSLKNLRIALLLAITACILRPTNTMIWFCVIAPSLINILSSTPRIPFTDNLIFLREGVVCGLLVLGISGLSDRLYFGFWTFPPYQWLTFNITLDLAVFYGRNDWHYFFSQGLPLLTTTYLPFTIIGLWKAAPGIQMTFVIIIFQMIGTLSLIAHKEVRFIYPLLPLFHILTGPAIASFFTTPIQASKYTTISQPSTSKPRLTLRRKPLLIALLLANAGIAYYTSHRHQSGVIAVQKYLRHEYESLYLSNNSKTSSPDAEKPLFAAYLLPCHSNPWRSSLVHPGLRAWALTCEPPITVPPSERSAYKDEADVFYDNPARFLRELAGGKGREWPPRFIVGFQGLQEIIEGLAEGGGKGGLGMKTKERWRVFNSDWIDDERRAGDVVVWEVLNE